MDRAGDDGSVVVWVWCGYYCVCAGVTPAADGQQARTELIGPRLPSRWRRPRPRRVVRRLAAQWTEDQLPWSEPPTYPLARG